MALSLAAQEFDSWLSKELRNLGIDESVYCSYIAGMLSEDSTKEEKKETLTMLLNGLLGPDVKDICTEVLEKWYECSCQDLDSETTTTTEPKEDVEERLVKLLEKSTFSPHEAENKKQYTEDEKKLRDRILTNYGETSDHEDVEEEDEVENKVKDPALMKNTNTSSVIQAEKEKRERARQENQKKKEKDREDRERQRQHQQERKEKRKTQKGERRR